MKQEIQQQIDHDERLELIKQAAERLKVKFEPENDENAAFAQSFFLEHFREDE
jgi:hypothetical protein